MEWSCTLRQRIESERRKAGSWLSRGDKQQVGQCSTRERESQGVSLEKKDPEAAGQQGLTSQGKHVGKEQSTLCMRTAGSKTEGPTHKETIMLGSMTRPWWADQNLPQQPAGLFLCISGEKMFASTEAQGSAPTTHPHSLPTIPHLPVLPGHCHQGPTVLT